MQDLLSIVAAFPNRRVLLFGDFMLDRYVFGDAERISPEAPVPVLRVVERQDRVGGAGSVALNIVSLDARVHCFGLIGRDREGELVRRLLDEAGADVSGLLAADDRPTITKTRFVGLAEHRHRQQILRVDDEIIRAPTPPVAAALLDTALKLLPECDVICLEDYAKGLLTPELCEAVISAARRHEKPVYVDPARAREWEKYRRSAVLTPNRAELETAVGRRLQNDELARAAADVAADLELDAVLVTLGRDGMLLVSADGEPETFPTTPRAVYDNTGAGDAVLAALAVARAAGATMPQAIALANIAGGLEVSKFGCVPIQRRELLHELQHGPAGDRGKLRRLDELLAELQTRRQRGETVVFTNGCFDVLHPGHVDLLARARAFGSLLVVGLNSDESVRRQGKGPDRPVRNQDARVQMLAALEAVDYIVVFNEDTPVRLLEAIRPDILAKGAQYGRDGVVGREIVERYGGRVVLIEMVAGYSTTGELKRIRAAERG